MTQQQKSKIKAYINVSISRRWLARFNLVLLVLMAQQAIAYPTFLEQFNNQYPLSSTSQAGCATCHASASGGRPWNAYGRDLIANGGSVGVAGNVVPAILAVEFLNSDAVGGTNLTEIQADTQPGWCDPSTTGCDNQTYNANGSTAGIGTPPGGLTLDDSSSTSPPNLVDRFDGTNTSYSWAEIGTWYINSGTYNQDNTTGSYSTYAGHLAWDAYTFKADMITVSSSDPSSGWLASSLAFRVSDTQNMYFVKLHTDGVLRLRSTVSGVNTLLASAATSYSPFAWHRYKVVVRGDSIKVYIDNELLIDTNNSDHAKGYIGLRTRNSSVSVDNVTVTQPPPGC
jgi:hypothetical protein